MGNQQTSDPTSPDGPDNPGQYQNSVLMAKLEVCFQEMINYTNTSDDAFLDVNHFQKLFHSCPTFGESLYSQCLHESIHSEATEVNISHIDKDHFMVFGSKLLQMVGSQAQKEFYFSVFSRQKSTLNIQDFHRLVSTCYKISMLNANLTSPTEVDQLQIFTTMEKGLFGKEMTVDKGDFLHWCGRHCPRLLNVLHPFVCAVLCSDKHVQQVEAASLSESQLSIDDNRYLLTWPVLWSLSSYIPMSYTAAVESSAKDDVISTTYPMSDVTGPGGWQLLYDSNTHGLSMNRFQHHVMSYAAASLTFVKLEDHVYCIGCDTAWSDRTDRWGCEDCFLLQIHPQFRVIQVGAKMMYLNTLDRKSPKGLYIGKDSRTTMIQIDDAFNKVKHYGIDIPLQTIEVWGCGSRTVLDAQQKQVQWEHKQAEKSKDRKLKLEDWKDNPDRELLNLGGIKTEHAER